MCSPFLTVLCVLGGLWHVQVVNNVEAGVLEPALSKTKMIQVGWLLQQRLQ